MKLILAIVVLIIVFGFLWADYRWRRWIKDREEERNREQNRDVK
jgi:hypothetical protein